MHICNYGPYRLEISSFRKKLVLKLCLNRLSQCKGSSDCNFFFAVKYAFCVLFRKLVYHYVTSTDLLTKQPTNERMSNVIYPQALLPVSKWNTNRRVNTPHDPHIISCILDGRYKPKVNFSFTMKLLWWTVSPFLRQNKNKTDIGRINTNVRQIFLSWLALN